MNDDMESDELGREGTNPMTNVVARLIAPRENVAGNVLWRRAAIAGHESQLQESLAELRERSYWASPFPEGDGFTFQIDGKSDAELLEDITACFPWMDLTMATSRAWAIEVADLEDARTHRCTVMVPLSKLLLERSFKLGSFRFVCPYHLDDEPSNRLGHYQDAYLQFEADFEYRDLLRASAAIPFRDALIRRCLTMAEHGLDLIRFDHGSFLRPEYTPNPAGLRSDGFYGVEIVTHGRLPLKDLVLEGLAAPLTTTNNHLGPDLTDPPSEEAKLLAALLQDRHDELANAVRRTLRACRQSFYSLGDESRFLNLVFALDGLVGLEKDWTSWKQRTYVSALISQGRAGNFERTLIRYDDLYSKVRNPLVHGGRDFYQLEEDPAKACEFLHGCIKDVINLVTTRELDGKDKLQALALDWLRTPAISSIYTKIITDHPAGGARKVPDWTRS